MTTEVETKISLPATLDGEHIELPTAAIVFGKGGPEAIIAHLQGLARTQVEGADATTESGRAKLKSTAYQVARSKTTIDDLGKKHSEDARRIIDDVNAGRRKIKAALEELQDEIRKPVTDWEEAEEKRVADHEEALQSMEALLSFPVAPSAATVRERLERFLARRPRDWEEFTDRALAMVAHVEKNLMDAVARQEKYEAEQAELAELRLIKAERDAKIAKDAADAAAAAAEKKRKDELEEAKETARLAAEKKAEQDAKDAKVAADAAAAKAAEQLKQAEEKRIADLAAHKAQAEEAARQAQLEADRKQQKAIEEDRIRVERDRRAQEAIDQQRAADLEHRKRINGQAVAALMSELAYVEDEAKELIMAIVRGKIPHVTVNY